MSDTVFIALIAAIVVPIMGTIVTAIGVVIKYFQDKAIANANTERDKHAAALAQNVALKVEETRKDLITQNNNVDKKLDVIHEQVNSQLTKALDKVVNLQDDIVTLKELLLSRMKGEPYVEPAGHKAKSEVDAKIQSKVEEITEKAADLTSQTADVAKQAADITMQAAQIAKDSK